VCNSRRGHSSKARETPGDNVIQNKTRSLVKYIFIGATTSLHATDSTTAKSEREIEPKHNMYHVLNPKRKKRVLFHTPAACVCICGRSIEFFSTQVQCFVTYAMHAR